MKRTLIAAMISGFALAPAAWANEAHHPDKAKAPDQAVAAPAKQATDSTAQRMQENVKRMQTQIDAVRKAADQGERDKLLAEHQQTMRENMALGQSMMQGRGMGMMGGQGGMGMMGGQGGMGMMGGQGGMGMMDQCMKMMAGAQGAGMPDAAARMEQMEKRMDMMQMMMGQMAGRSAAPSGEPKK